MSLSRIVREQDIILGNNYRATSDSCTCLQAVSLLKLLEVLLLESLVLGHPPKPIVMNA
jgi:hypothetical protein